MGGSRNDMVDEDVIEEVVPAALAGERLDRIVSLIADISRSEASATLAAEGVRVDGKVVLGGKVRLSEGSTVSIDPSLIPVEAPPSADGDVVFDVVFADDDIVVVDKPAGLVVHPGPGHRHGTLVNGLLARFPEIGVVGEAYRPGIVHRLDQGTSGLLVVCRTERAHRDLTEKLADRQVKRDYVALVWGHLEAESSTIDAPIARDPQHPLRMAVVPSGKAARTHVAVLQRFTEPDMTLVQCELETGRTHQIRVHLKAIGHPVVGDPVYGGARSSQLGRPFLHAARLAFEHPISKKAMIFESPLPEDLRHFLSGLSGSC